MGVREIRDIDKSLASLIRELDSNVKLHHLLDMDVPTMVLWIKQINPEFVSIGADSRKCGLPEPDEYELNELIRELDKFTEVRLKSNLKRLMPTMVDAQLDWVENRRYSPNMPNG